MVSTMYYLNQARSLEVIYYNNFKGRKVPPWCHTDHILENLSETQIKLNENKYFKTVHLNKDL